MGIFALIIGTALAVWYVILLRKGKQYDYMAEPLEGDAFPLKFLYGVGYAMQEKRPAALRGRFGNKLREQTTLYYGRQYGEFYARAVWAQILSLPAFFLAFFLLLAAVMPAENAGFFVFIGLVAAIMTAYYFLTYTKGKLDARRLAFEDEFPNAISKLALLVNSGVILRDAWRMVAYGKEHEFYDMMRKACDDMENGQSEIDAIYEFGVVSNSPDIKKFTSALIQSIERGGGELPIFLANQSSEIWAQRRQILLQKGEKAASALLMPIGLMFAGVMLIVLASALQSF